MYYLVYLFSTESWLRSTTTTKRETRIEEKKKKIRKKKKDETRRKETRYIYTHEKHERHARKRDGRIVASVRARAKRRYALANFYAEAVARCDFDTRDTIFFRIYASTRIHRYTDTQIHRQHAYIHTLDTYIHTYRERGEKRKSRKALLKSHAHAYI